VENHLAIAWSFKKSRIPIISPHEARAVGWQIEMVDDPLQLLFSGQLDVARRYHAYVDVGIFDDPNLIDSSRQDELCDLSIGHTV